MTRALQGCPIATALAELREQVLTTPPEDMGDRESPEIGRELNEWRRVLGRLHAVHTSGGRVTGWGDQLVPPIPKPAVGVKSGRTSTSTA